MLITVVVGPVTVLVVPESVVVVRITVVVGPVTVVVVSDGFEDVVVDVVVVTMNGM